MLGPSINWGFCCSSETIRLLPLWALINTWTHGPWAQCVTFPTLGEVKSSNEHCEDEIWITGVEPGKGTETHLQSWNTTSKTCILWHFSHLFHKSLGGKNYYFFPSFSSSFWILVFLTVIYSVLSLVIYTLYFNICTCFGSHVQSLVLSSLNEIWEPYIYPLCCRQRKYWAPPDPIHFFVLTHLYV